MHETDSGLRCLLMCFQDLDVRIIVAQFEEDSVSEVFCCVSSEVTTGSSDLIGGSITQRLVEGSCLTSGWFPCDLQAYRLNLFGSRYQWIVVDGGTGGWRLGGHVSGCRTTSVLTAADGSIRLQIRQLGDTNTPGVSGRVRKSR